MYVYYDLVTNSVPAANDNISWVMMKLLQLLLSHDVLLIVILAVRTHTVTYCWRVWIPCDGCASVFEPADLESASSVKLAAHGGDSDW